MGGAPLIERFPYLYSLSSQKERSVTEVLELVEGRKVWRLLWRMKLFVWELKLLEQMRFVIDNWVVLDEEDGWVWKPEEGEILR